MIHEEKTQTTCVLRLFGAPLWAVQQAVQQTGLAAQFRSRGAETLAALQAETPTALSKARKALADRFAAELYGEGEMTLVHAAVQALETHHRLLVCCDADAGTLLEARMETVAGAEKVFDFGAMSYADAKVREKLSAKVCRVKGGPVPAKLTRVRAAQRLVGADFAAGRCPDGAAPAGQAGAGCTDSSAAQTAQGAECPDFSADSGTGRVCRCVVLHRRRPRRPAAAAAKPWGRQPAALRRKTDIKKTPEGVNLPGFFCL